MEPDVCIMSKRLLHKMTNGDGTREVWCGDAVEWLSSQDRIDGAVVTSIPGLC